MADYLISRAAIGTLEQYLIDRDFQFAAERAFIIMGEAMTLLKKHHPDIATELDRHLAVIGFRNLIVHRYWGIDNREVWSVITTDIPALKIVVQQLLRSPEVGN
jgi:uncharacterized protein with HEPN domain